MKERPPNRSPQPGMPEVEPCERGQCIFVMGVSGSGKSSLGLQIAKALRFQFFDGDNLHPDANIRKMAEGIPLCDEDRMPWLDRIRETAQDAMNSKQGVVIACSALKRSYRDRLRVSKEPITFLFLDGDYELIANRMRERKEHFMKETMLQSQFETLERPEEECDVIAVDIGPPMQEVASQALERLRSRLSDVGVYPCD